MFLFQLTVNSMAEFFKTGKGVDLEVLTSATLSKLEEIKEKTATGESIQSLLLENVIGTYFCSSFGIMSVFECLMFC